MTILAKNLMKKCNQKSSQISQLERALRIQQKVASAGFDWPTWHGALDKVVEETNEVKAELEAPVQNSHKVDEELGDLLFAIVNVVRHQKSDPDQLLKAASDKFEKRYLLTAHYVQQLGLTMEEASDDQMEAGWQYAKQQEKEST